MFVDSDGVAKEVAWEVMLCRAAWLVCVGRVGGRAERWSVCSGKFVSRRNLISKVLITQAAAGGSLGKVSEVW